jgi:hypothetical protein
LFGGDDRKSISLFIHVHSGMMRWRERKKAWRSFVVPWMEVNSHFLAVLLVLVKFLHVFLAIALCILKRQMLGRPSFLQPLLLHRRQRQDLSLSPWSLLPSIAVFRVKRKT